MPLICGERLYLGFFDCLAPLPNSYPKGGIYAGRDG